MILRTILGGKPIASTLASRSQSKTLAASIFASEQTARMMPPICGALVYLWRQRAALAGDLWDRLSNAASDTAYPEGNNLVFERLLSESDGPNFREHFEPGHR